MKKQITILILILNSTILLGQNKDYIILRQTETTKIDTIYGEIVFPKNGVITKVKIISNNEKMKYHPNKVIGFKYGERYFSSVPYNLRGNVFAERIVNGKIDLCYYDTNTNRYNGGLAGAAATSLTSYYFIKSNTTEKYLRVPHSREKAREEISALFKNNEKIYSQILSDEFRVWKLPEIVKEYNDKK
ncbi:MAG: hypothetical protein GXO81_06000 [Chlorobi bacterium]|nr:hypothetical protein [Chlorobiota bacterium]